MSTVHMALTGNVGAVRAVVAGIAGRYPTTEHQVPRAPGMLHTRIYDFDTTTARSDQKTTDLAPAGVGTVQAKLSGDADGIDHLATWMARLLRSDEIESSHGGGRLSFDVHPDEAPTGARPSA
jgi:hypothetical protein